MERMFLTNRIDGLKERVNMAIQPGKELHLHRYYHIDSDATKFIDVPQTSIGHLKAFFKRQKVIYKLNSFEILEGMAFYEKEILRVTEKELSKTNKLFEFQEMYPEWSIDTYNLYFGSYLITVDKNWFEERAEYENRLKWEAIESSSNPKEKLLKQIHDLESQILVQNSKKNRLSLEFFKTKKEAFFKEVDITANEKSSNHFIKWTGSDVELAELVKALIESKRIKGGNQGSIFDALAASLNMSKKFDQKNHLQNLRKRKEPKAEFLRELVGYMETWMTKSDAIK